MNNIISTCLRSILQKSKFKIESAPLRKNHEDCIDTEDKNVIINLDSSDR